MQEPILTAEVKLCILEEYKKLHGGKFKQGFKDWFKTIKGE